MRPKAGTPVPVSLEVVKWNANQIKEDETYELRLHAMLCHDPSEAGAIAPRSFRTVKGFARMTDGRVLQKTPSYAHIHKRKDQFAVFAGAIDC